MASARMERPRLTTLLTASVVGTYLLIALGATAATTESGLIPFAAHAFVGIGVGLLLTVVVLDAWASTTVSLLDRSRPNLVRWAITAAFVAYPLQAAGGLAIAVDGSLVSTQAHLFGGLVVFSALMIALVWQLEVEVGVGRRDGSSSGYLESDPSSPHPTVDPPSTPLPTESSPTPLPTESSPAHPSAESSPERSPPFRGRPTDLDPSADDLRSDRLRWDSFRRTVDAYLSLTKPRLMWLLCLLALAGMGLATTAGGVLTGGAVVATLTGGVLAIGASGTFNHVYERDRDRKMDRTADRPIATDRVPPGRATLFGIVLAGLSMATLFVFVNALAAVLTAVAIVYYSVVYTAILKPNTQWNTVIGGGAGALPAVIGYTAVTGRIGLPGLVLALVVFCWTPAHFYNLAIAHRDDYERASYPMLPVVRGVPVTRRRILFWLGLTLLTSLWLGVLADLGALYALAATILGGVFIWSIVRQYRLDTAPAAFRSFHASNLYLGGVLAVVLVETLVL